MTRDEAELDAATDINDAMSALAPMVHGLVGQFDIRVATVALLIWGGRIAGWGQAPEHLLEQLLDKVREVYKERRKESLEATVDGKEWPN